MPESIGLSVSDKLERLEACIRDYGRPIVAFSGGVDSTLVAAVAHRVFGSEALAVTGVSPSLAESEKQGAKFLAQQLGFPHRFVTTEELNREGYRRNSGDRCFHCKSELFERLGEVAKSEGFCSVLSGDNLDDTSGHRPGLNAAKEFGVGKPLIEVEFGKKEIREMAAHLGLPNAAKVASPCLASRIPVGTRVDAEILKQIDRAESELSKLGFSAFRVRHHGEVARLEVQAEDFPKVVELRKEIDRALRLVGYRWISLDLRGYRSGSLSVLN